MLTERHPLLKQPLCPRRRPSPRGLSGTTRCAALGAALAALALAGCGSSGHVGGHLDQRGQTTPDAAISMSASINGRTVLVSPTTAGAGQMIFNVSNTDGSAKTLVLRPARGHGTSVRIGQIPAGGTYQVKLDLKPGKYQLASPYVTAATLGSTGRQLKAATLTVGAYRSGGNNAVEQP